LARHRASEQVEQGVSRGFTLVEMLVAVALLSIIVTVIYGAFHTMGRVIRRSERSKDAYQLARLIMSRMRQDLSCAHFPPNSKDFVFRGEDMGGYDTDADALTFVTAGHVISRRDFPEGDMAEVSYYIDEDNPGLLVRREDVSPDDELETGGVLDILGKNVVGLNFTYLDGTEEPARRAGRDEVSVETALEEESAWKDEWDSAETPYLPRAVKVDLSVLNERGQIEDFSTTIVLAMGRTPTSLQPTAGVGPQVRGGPARTGRTGRSPTQPERLGPVPRRVGPSRGPGEGRGFVPGGREGPGGRGDMRRPPQPGSEPQVPGTPTTRRRPYGTTPGTRPPTPGGRR
jgi:prepilin-type N-terminal cleavage/methylation domain-containing protein